MKRRKFTREFNLEAVRLIKEGSVPYAQAAEDLGVHSNPWRRALAAISTRAPSGMLRT
jgi:transposase